MMDGKTRMRANEVSSEGVKDAFLQGVKARILSVGVEPAVGVASRGLASLVAEYQDGIENTRLLATEVDRRVRDRSPKAEAPIKARVNEIDRLGRVSATVAELRKAVEMLPAAVGAGVLVPLDRQGKALESSGQRSAFRAVEALYDAVTTLVKADVAMNGKLPPFPFARIGVQAPTVMPYQNTPAQVALRSGQMLAGIAALQAETDARDSQGLEIDLWRIRVEVTTALGLASEAKASEMVAVNLERARDIQIVDAPITQSVHPAFPR